jgi:hypothetical protein
MPTESKPRIFEECGLFNPLLAEFDFDTEMPLVHLDPPIVHQEASGRFVFPEDSPFRFLSGGSTASQIEAKRGEPVQVAIRAADIAAVAGRGEPTVRLSETLTLFRSAQPIRVLVHASVRVFRSGPPRPEVRIHPVKSVDLAAELPPDGQVLLGQIDLAPDRLGSIECRGHAYLSASASVTLGGVELPIVFRRHHRGDDERDRGWLTADALDWLEFDAFLAGVNIKQLDYGIPYHSLRQLLARSGDRNRETSSLAVDVRVDMITRENATTRLAGEPYSVEVVGSPTDAVTFSGLAGSPPRRLVLTRDHTEPTVYTFPRVRMRSARGGDSRPFAEPIELVVTSDSDRLDVEVTATLRSARREWPALQDTRSLWDRYDEAVFPIPLDQVLPQAVADLEPDEKLTIEIVAQIHNQPDTEGRFTNSFTFLSEIESGSDLPTWLCCIDLGTSSTAICIVNTTPLSQAYQLALGDWLARVDKFHSESIVWLNSTAGSRLSKANLVSYLLPSNIGLASDRNLRADYDPLSMGNLQLSLPGAQGAEARLAGLHRTYDVSMPFPSTTHMADYAGAIVTEPKKRMIMRSEYVALGADVPERDASGRVSQVRRVELAKLVEDCFDELGGYTAQSVLSEDAADSVAREIEHARLDPDVRFGVVVTHPSGIDQARRDIYRRAGQRFLRAFCGEDRAKPDNVTLVAEALAAARYGIDDFLDRDRTAASAPHNFITLDIGAGTFDVTTIGYAGPETGAWRILNHFGLAIGGNDLDRILVRRICGILQQAAEMDSIRESFQIDAALLNDGGDAAAIREHPARSRLKLEFQGAKARLTRILLDPVRESYQWSRKDEGGLPLDITVYEPEPADTSTREKSDIWAVRPRRSNEVSREIVPGAELRFDPKGDNKPAVRLRLWRDFFDEPHPSDDDGMRVLLAMMGEELPKMALCQVASSRGPATVIIVTGRAALWPPLYERIEATVAMSQDAGAVMARRKPFPAERMKQAVVRGAVSLAPEWLEAESTIENPIAIVTFKVDVYSTEAISPSRAIDTVMLLVDDRMEGRRDDVVTKRPFVIARIIPGLDREEGLKARLELFHDLYRICRIKPFVELTPELGRSARAAVMWKVRWRRDASGLRLTFESDTEPTIEFGPFGGGRVYGPQ